MSSNIYTTGLRNDGSYKVSGQPFIVRKVINVGEEVKVELPYVTKNVTIRIPTPPNNAIQTMGSGQGRFMTSNTNPPGPGVYDLGGSGKDFTVSFWYKQTETWTINRNPFTLTLNNGSPKRFRMRGGANKHAYEGINSTGFAGPNGDFEWFRVTVTQKTGSTFLYFDDEGK